MPLFRREIPDQRLIAMILTEGRPANRALDQIYRTMGRPIQGQLVGMGASPDEAADSFQEALLEFLVVLRRPEFVLRKSIADWLFVASKNRWLNERGRQQRLDRHADGIRLAYIGHREKVSADWLEAMLYRILAALDPKCRLLLEWTYMEGRDRNWVAAQLGFKNLNAVSNKRTSCLDQALELGRREGYFDQ